MHTSNATKITKHQVLISNSSKHHIALLHQTFGHQDGLKLAWHNCRGIVTADVLKLGLSRGAIATRKLEGVMRDKKHEGLYWFGPLR